MFLTENVEAPAIDWSSVISTFVQWCITTGIRLIIGLLLLSITFRIVNRITKKIYLRLQAKDADETISKVITSTIRLVAKVLIIISFVGFIGIETASITAAIASLGVALGLALQGALSNVAGGIIIVFTRPFRIGDYITSNGESGTVENIKLFYTEIVTPDNKVVHIPNGSLANNVIVNVTAKDIRRVDMMFSVSYDTDLELAKKCLLDLVSSHEKVLTEKEPFVTVKEHGASSINFTVRCWCNKSDYWDIYWFMMSQVPVEFAKNNIEIPYNKLDVHIKK